MLAHCPHFQYFCYCFSSNWNAIGIIIRYIFCILMDLWVWMVYIYMYIFVCITLFFCWATALCVSSDSTKWYSRSMDSCRRTLALQDVNLFPVRRKKPFDMSECPKKCQTEWIYIYIPRSSFVALFSGRLYRLLTSFEISVRKSSSWPKRLLLQFTYDFPGFISCCTTMLYTFHLIQSYFSWIP